jgi:DnaJ domain
MIYPLAAIVLLWLALSRSGAFPRLFPFMTPGTLEKLASVASVAVALLVLVRGNVWAALLIFGVALWLLGRSSRRPEAASSTRTHVSRVRSAMIEMDFDQARARMTGRIIAGPYEGNALDRLDQAQCETVYRMCQRDDPDGARLLEAYFHRRFAGWRPAGEAHADTRSARARGSSRMSEDEAYEVLGLRRGAARDEVVRAHRAVMKKWHPDQGGTADLAARANEAKEVLLRRHA